MSVAEDPREDVANCAKDLLAHEEEVERLSALLSNERDAVKMARVNLRAATLALRASETASKSERRALPRKLS